MSLRKFVISRLQPLGSALPAVVLLTVALPVAALANRWEAAWPKTDFSLHSVPLEEIVSGGPGKDGIPSIDAPSFVSVAEMHARGALAPQEPVIGFAVEGDARAYPLRILTWHEIVNDEVGGLPVAVTYCPLCNSAVVFDRRLGDRILEFGVTGNLRHSDMVMYDRNTESWWQQFLGEAVVGELTGSRLKAIPARLESWERFSARHADGKVLMPNGDVRRPYGVNPYRGYDSSAEPFLYRGDYPKDIAPMTRVVAVGTQAWSLPLLRDKGRIESGDLVLTWEAGQSSALDGGTIAEGRDVGNVVVQRKTESGLADVPYDVTFAFVFHAFQPEGTWHLK
ncbi:MAG: DUF3179 domain-containing protein [Kiloniellales bacterium]|nr:DUF3179 domain-containing protein [Kiloniellales bacterium]